MYARLKNLVVTSALVGATLTGSALMMSQHRSDVRVSAASQGTGACKPGQGDACKPGGCCIVN